MSSSLASVKTEIEYSSKKTRKKERKKERKKYIKIVKSKRKKRRNILWESETKKSYIGFIATIKANKPSLLTESVASANMAAF